ncbi:MAG TPA: hypothetical protein VD837_09715 [Terriglobales bacterium]|nr:hypothetical protein [Terriglobales bacterium]
MAKTGSERALSKNTEEQQERSSALKVIGLGLIVAAMLVFFFLPAGQKLGQERGFFIIVGVLVAAGLGLIIAGSVRRARG